MKVTSHGFRKSVEVEKVPSDNPELISKILAKEVVIKFYGSAALNWQQLQSNLIAFRRLLLLLLKNFRWRK